MINPSTAIITLDVFNVYSEKIEERIEKARTNNGIKIFIGDCLNYTILLFKKAGYIQEDDTYKEIIDVIETVLSLCIKKDKEKISLNWSNDLNYIEITN